MKTTPNYFLTLNNEIIFVGNKKQTEKKRKEFQRKGIKVQKWFGHKPKIGNLTK